MDDYYGISGWGWVPLITFITSCDMKIVDRDEDTGRYYVAYEDNTEKMLSLIDILVDGRYVDAQRNISLRFRGSENQRIIDMDRTRAAGRIVLWEGMNGWK